MPANPESPFTNTSWLTTGKNNATLIKYLSKGLGVSKSSVRLLSGDTSREKRIEVVGLSTDDLLEALKKLLSDG